MKQNLFAGLILLVAACPVFAQQIPGEKINPTYSFFRIAGNNDEKLNHLNFFFQEFSNNNTSLSGFEHLSQYLQQVSSQEQEHLIKIFQLIGKLRASIRGGDTSILDQLDFQLRQLHVDPGTLNYVLYSFYMQAARENKDREAMRDAEKYLKTAALHGEIHAVCLWLNLQLDRTNQLDQDTRQVIKMLQFYNNASDQGYPFLIDRINLVSGDVNAKKLALFSLVHNKDGILSGNGIASKDPFGGISHRVLLEAGLELLINGDKDDDLKTGVELFIGFASRPSDPDIDPLIKLIHYANILLPKHPELVASCRQTVTNIVQTPRRFRTASQFMRGYLTQKGWADQDTLRRLEQGEDFITLCLEKMKQQPEPVPRDFKTIFLYPSQNTAKPAAHANQPSK